MDMDLICSENIKKILEEVLANRKITINKDSKICIIEKGFHLEPGKIGIYFDIPTLNLLIDYLDNIIRSKEDVKNIITARCQEDELKVIIYNNIYYFEAMGNNVFCRT